MSDSNIEIIRAFVSAANARAVPDQLIAPGFLMENRISSVTDFEYHGTEGWREWMSDVFEHFKKGAVYELEEVIASGDDFVAGVFCISGQGAFSEEMIEFRWACVTWLRAGKVTRAVGYPSRREALRAVGLH